ncbi:MAG: hypothetical protein JNM56_20665 [Planctomycetia bacterium]|nr:hypothetical protein [Planctomycetia bacterium]
MPRHAFAPLLLLLFLPGGLVFALFSTAPPGFVAGQVVDDSGPVAGARVRFKAQPDAVWSDRAGRFFLPLSPGPVQRVTATHPGYFIGGASSERAPVSVRLRRLPTEDCPEYAWVAPTPNRLQSHQCGNCHAEIYREWAASGHARAATNRRFLNLYDGTDWQGRPNVGWNLLADQPDGASVCAACHVPTIPSVFDDVRAVQGTAAHGVHCDYCHKIDRLDERADLGKTFGSFAYRLLRPKEGQLFFGPLDDVDRNEDVYSPFYRESRYCAGCHEGTVFGVHAYGTFSEWLASPARREGKSCQSCHMKPTGLMTNIAPGKGGVERDPQTLASHGMFAGSQAAMLRQSVRLEVNDFEQAGNAISFEVVVSARDVGHRVPTGFPDRHLVLVVDTQPTGDDMPLAFGPVLPASAGPELAGRPGKLFAKQLTDADGDAPAPFWRALPEFSDTRLTPGRPDRSRFRLLNPQRVELRLLYRRFWPSTTASKGWPDETIVLATKSVYVAR